MKHHILSLAVVAAITATPFTATVASATADEILPVHGERICQGGQCLRVDTESGRVQLFGRYSAAIPDGVKVMNGSVSTTDFRRMLQVASLAAAYGSGRR